jgi:hypothetical protein
MLLLLLLLLLLLPAGTWLPVMKLCCHSLCPWLDVQQQWGRRPA